MFSMLSGLAMIQGSPLFQNGFNPYLPNGLFHPHQLDESILNFRGVWCTFSFLFYFELKCL